MSLFFAADSYGEADIDMMIDANATVTLSCWTEFEPTAKAKDPV